MLIEEFGLTDSAHNAFGIYFDKSTRQHARYVLRSYRGSLDRLMNMYVVISNDGEYVTVGHRTRRFKRRK